MGDFRRESQSGSADRKHLVRCSVSLYGVDLLQSYILCRHRATCYYGTRKFDKDVDTVSDVVVPAKPCPALFDAPAANHTVINHLAFSKFCTGHYVLAGHYAGKALP